MTFEATKIELSSSLQTITDLLPTLTDSDWSRPQNGKWTVGQEFEHLRVSTQGTAFLLSPMNRTAWRANERESRSYDTIVAEYKAALAARGPITNNAFGPTADSDHLTVAKQAERWQQVVEQLRSVVASLPETELDAYTVWKHPLLGPLTGREMLYFTAYHARHHHASLTRKQMDVHL
ncbi:DinB family protein [Spirosoma montaniterrae]|uniref:DinB-like domain-containing protein n=1 Tax=Spirosoma montaniterrae TaxID=1178516 RepID=A0A1P9WS09_9BACT|nr:DinB family protein [Spirosoma montaniterrae]AQG78165.1 hypothetical protein AWR27_01660 [Spirosoma montaniterrae]